MALTLQQLMALKQAMAQKNVAAVPASPVAAQQVSALQKSRATTPRGVAPGAYGYAKGGNVGCYADGGEVDDLAPYMPTPQEEAASGFPPGPQRAMYIAQKKKNAADAAAMAKDSGQPMPPGYANGGSVADNHTGDVYIKGVGWKSDIDKFNSAMAHHTLLPPMNGRGEMMASKISPEDAAQLGEDQTAAEHETGKITPEQFAAAMQKMQATQPARSTPPQMVSPAPAPDVSAAVVPDNGYAKGGNVDCYVDGGSVLDNELPGVAYDIKTSPDKWDPKERPKDAATVKPQEEAPVQRAPSGDVDSPDYDPTMDKALTGKGIAYNKEGKIQGLAEGGDVEESDDDSGDDEASPATDEATTLTPEQVAVMKAKLAGNLQNATKEDPTAELKSVEEASKPGMRGPDDGSEEKIRDLVKQIVATKTPPKDSEDDDSDDEDEDGQDDTPAKSPAMARAKQALASVKGAPKEADDEETDEDDAAPAAKPGQQDAIAALLARFGVGPDGDAKLAAAQQAQKDAMRNNALILGGQQIAGAFARGRGGNVPVDTLGVEMRNQMAAQPVQNVMQQKAAVKDALANGMTVSDLQDKTQADDPTSPVSQAARNIIASSFPDIAKQPNFNTMNYSTIKGMAPVVENILTNQTRQEMAQERAETSRSNAQLRSDTMKNQMEDREQAKQTAAYNQMTQYLEAQRSTNPAVAQAEKDLYSTAKIGTIEKTFGDPNNLSPQMSKVLQQEVAKVATGGIPTYHELEALNPGTLRGTLASAWSKLSNSPTPANAGDFLKQYTDYANGVSGDAKKVILDHYNRVINTRKGQFSPEQNQMLKDNYLNRFGDVSGNANSASGANSNYAADVMNYSRAHNITPDQAQAIKDARTKGAQ